MKNKNNITTGNQGAAPTAAQSRQPRNQSASRRKALKTALAGGAVVTAGSVSTKWVVPVVDSVVLPGHAQTSVQILCSCSIEGATVDSGTNSFSVAYSWDGCPGQALANMRIRGPGVEEPLGYTSAQNPRTFTDTGPYNNTQFQAGETYIFTLIVFEDSLNIDGAEVATCNTTVVAQ